MKTYPCYLCELNATIISWSMATLVLSVTFHATALFLLAKLTFAESVVERRHKSVVFSLTVFTLLCLIVIFINSFEICAWALLYYAHGATDNPVIAFVHSLGSFTTYGNSSHFPEITWKLVSHLEAMNGLVAFGITTAFLYSASGRLHDFAK